MSTATAAHTRYAGLPAETLMRMLIEKRKETDAVVTALLAKTIAAAAAPAHAPAHAPARRLSAVTTSSTLSDEIVVDFRPLTSLLPPYSPLLPLLDRESASPPPLSLLTAEEDSEEDEETRTDYTASEVAAMTDEELLAAVGRICGITHLSCKHCRNTEVPLAKFVESIRRRCSKPWKGKSGLFPEVELPKSCDNQSERNRRSNSVNNKYFTLIKKATSPEEVEALQMQRSEALFAATDGKIVPKRIAKQAAAAGAGAH